MTPPARSAAALAAAASILAGCALGPPPAAPGFVSPGRFAEAGDAAAAYPKAGWWRGFRSGELDRLVAAGLAANPDLTIAEARLRQADARVRLAGAGLLPSVDASAGATRTRTGLEGPRGRSGVGYAYDAGLNAAWELDLWGGNRAALAAAEASAEADRFEREGVALTVASGVARTYFEVLALRDRLRTARANLDNARRVLRLVEVRVAQGAASPLDLARQESQVATQAAALPALELQERQAVSALALLLGRSLDGFAVAADSLRDVEPVPVLAGVPSDLLRRRPDLAAAEARLAAASADVAAARAALYPSIDLTARAGLASDALLSILGQTNVISVGASLLAPVFDGGRRRAQVRLSEAQRLELLASYRGAVLAALADVEDALAAVRQTRRRETSLATAAEQARRAFAIAEAQYRAGAIGLFELLDAQRTLFSAQDAVASARLDRLSGLVDLYRALGGGWGGPETGGR